MGLALALVFRGTMRLLPLAVAVAATAITFGVAALAGAGLTMATVAALPILIGLAVDYAIQFQSRAREAPSADAGRGGARCRRSGGPDDRRCCARDGGRLPRAAALAGADGPRLCGGDRDRDCDRAAGHADRRRRRPGPGPLRPRRGRGVGPRRAGDPRAARPAPRARSSPTPGPQPGRVTAAGAPASAPAGAKADTPYVGHHVSWAARLTGHPGRVLAVAAALALVGWFADTQTAVSSDITKLVPANMPALRDLDELERVSGVSGEIDVTVHGADVATPATVAWMTAYESRLLAHFGYSQARGCARATLCPALSLPDLFAGSRLPGGHATLDRGAADGGAPLLLAGRDHREPPQRGAGLRDPADAAFRAAAGDRLHALAAASTERGATRSSPACRSWRRTRTRRCHRPGAGC